MDGNRFATDVQTTAQGDVVVAVHGTIDIASASLLKELLLTTIKRSATRTFIDLSDVSSIDSTGLGVLVSGAKKASPSSLALICNNEKILNVFTLLGLNRIFAIYGSRRAALGPPLCEIVEEADDE
jgi:anti-sigma B factor antagonist